MKATRFVDQSAIAADRTSSSTVPVATSSARSTRSTVVGRATDDNAKISESLAAKSSDGPKNLVKVSRTNRRLGQHPRLL